ncbi:MAG TPA: threonine/serine dehydratase [Synergistales bacterium]|nr:threonine/serine dehydratase [Synergistales bacterium]
MHRTNLITSRTLDSMTGTSLFLKPENLQRTGAFKIRGALNAVLSLEAEKGQRGIITASSGNHGQAVALAGAITGYPATVIMPEDASPAKVDAVRGYGARVIFCGTSSRERIEMAEDLCLSKGLTFIHPFDDPLVMAGQGTIGLEIISDLPDVDNVLVPVGGGGLISGIATAIKETDPKIRITGVEPEQSNSMYLSIQAGERQQLDNIVSIADGLKTSIPGRNTFPVVQKYVDDIILVSEEEIRKAVLILLERCKILVEPSGAVTVAALISGRLSVKGLKSVCVLSGGNFSLPELGKVILTGKVKGGPE